MDQMAYFDDKPDGYFTLSRVRTLTMLCLAIFHSLMTHEVKFVATGVLIAARRKKVGLLQ